MLHGMSAVSPRPAAPARPARGLLRLAAGGLLCLAAALPWPCGAGTAAPAGTPTAWAQPQHDSLAPSTEAAASAAAVAPDPAWRRWALRGLALGVGAAFGWALLRLGSGTRRGQAERHDSA